MDVLTGPDIDPQWDRVPEGSRVSYGTRPTPGTPISDVHAYEKPSNRDRFSILKCRVLEIDLVHLGARHRRAAFVETDDWAGTWLAP